MLFAFVETFFYTNWVLKTRKITTFLSTQIIQNSQQFFCFSTIIFSNTKTNKLFIIYLFTHKIIPSGGDGYEIFL
jgi:hypothetical protein